MEAVPIQTTTVGILYLLFHSLFPKNSTEATGRAVHLAVCGARDPTQICLYVKQAWCHQAVSPISSVDTTEEAMNKF